MFSNLASHIDSRSIFQGHIKEHTKSGGKPKDLSNLVGLNWKNNDRYDDGNLGGIVTFDGEHTNLEGVLF
jgi:hypothetical protein